MLGEYFSEKRSTFLFGRSLPALALYFFNLLLAAFVCFCHRKQAEITKVLCDANERVYFS